jgi:hypothetical protein
MCSPFLHIFAMFLPFPKIPSQSLLRPAENLLPDQEPDEPDEPDEPEPSDDAMEDDDNEGGRARRVKRVMGRLLELTLILVLMPNPTQVKKYKVALSHQQLWFQRKVHWDRKAEHL